MQEPKEVVYNIMRRREEVYERGKEKNKTSGCPFL